MGNNKENMRQAMKELLGLVGFGPEDQPAEQKREETPERKAPAAAPRPVAPERPAAPKAAAPERPAAPKATAPERPVAAERPAAARPVEQPKAEEHRTVEQPAAPKTAPKAAPAAETDMEDTRRKVATTVERGFFSFGEPKAPVFGGRTKQTYTPPVEEPVEEFYFQDEPTRPPFIRPGATVIAAGATFFGDIRAEGDVEVLGKVKGNLEATGNVRVVGKVLGDVKGEAVVLEGCTVQGNITSTSYVSLDEGAMVVGDVLATDFDSDGKVKGNLQIARAANFSSCALLAGNVIAATIVMAQGARVQGAVRIAEDPETNSLFGDLEI